MLLSTIICRIIRSVRHGGYGTDRLRLDRALLLSPGPRRMTYVVDGATGKLNGSFAVMAVEHADDAVKTLHDLPDWRQLMAIIRPDDVVEVPLEALGPFWRRGYDFGLGRPRPRVASVSDCP